MIYHNYIFFIANKTVSDIAANELKDYKKAFVNEIEQTQQVITYSYTTLGLKANTVFMLWLQADSPEYIQDLLNKLMHTTLGKYLTISHTLFGIARPTQYAPQSTNHNDTQRKGGRYLIIYPFTKTYEWHKLDFEKRRDLMKGHAAIGKNYPQITQLLLYAYGVDDSEFIVSYETEDLPDFQKLVMDLRSDKVRAYTQKDTPIFTCIYRPLDETLEFL